MIPQKLQIKNFLSYGPQLQTIDFTNYSLICLSGKNGHGKSALLDAMTWALWGQARKIGGATKADQGLLRLGQTQMLVVFDFLFGGKTYRIRREYMETYGKPINTLEFGMIDAETETFIPLTDKTIRTTQEKIEQTLRLDFESFANSAFLRQGSSNEFSKKSPKDRKHILASILGLDQYEVIRKLALEKTKEAHTKKTVLTALQEKRTQELLSQENLDRDLSELMLQMKQLEETEKSVTDIHQTYLTERHVWDEQKKIYLQTNFELQQLNASRETHKTQLREYLAQWRTINRQKKGFHTSNHLEQEKNNIIASIIHHQKMFQENLEHKQILLDITQQMSAIEQRYKEEQVKKKHVLQIELERLYAEQKNKHAHILQLQNTIEQYIKEQTVFSTTISAHENELSRITITHENIAKKEALLEKRKVAYQHYASLGNWISSELQSLAHKKKLVHKDDPSCPLCEQNLSAARKKFLNLNFSKQESFLIHRLQRLKRIIPSLKDMLLGEHALIIKDKELLQHAHTLRTKISEAITHQSKINEAISDTKHQLLKQENESSELSELIAKKEQIILTTQSQTLYIEDTAYHSLRTHQETIEKQLKNHAYHENDYKKDQAKLAAIDMQLREYESLQKDIAQQENRKNEILKLSILLKQLNKEITKLESKNKKLGNLDELLQVLVEKEKNIEKEQKIVQQRKEELLHTKGSVENQQKHLTKIKNEFEQENRAITQLEAIIEDYQTIATATGKDGIQALLIEEAIPEIEQEANYLLSRLTNNQAHIFIESLRDLKKGGTKETLDIKISDQAGIRPYELFSGGEAFRIDFALRIAISKLLARRAGTALQLLIIDEGFGSQDEEGLGYIMDALHKIQDDFSKIIIVSHLPSMKDQFPVQFVVQKGIQGSTVSVIEQG